MQRKNILTSQRRELRIWDCGKTKQDVMSKDGSAKDYVAVGIRKLNACRSEAILHQCEGLIERTNTRSVHYATELL